MDVKKRKGSAAPPPAPPPPPPERDADAMDPAVWPAKSLPAGVSGREHRYQLVFNPRALDTIHVHGRTAKGIEVCGVLVGNVYRDDAGPYCAVSAAIRGNYATGKAAQVTFTSATWTHINDTLERDHAGERIVGWYHTHPGFGIFLSEMDLFIHQNFFPEPWQTAFVYDPIRQEEGLFVWHGGKALRDPFLIESAPEVSALKTHEMTTMNAPPASGAEGPSSATLDELSARLQALEQRLRWVLAGAAVMIALSVAWPLVVVFVLAGNAPILPAALSPQAHSAAVPATEPAAKR